MPGYRYTHTEAKSGPQLTANAQEHLDAQLQQNIGLYLLDKGGYESAEAPALAALTALMKDHLLEVASVVKQSCEGQGRTQANLIDMLNAASEYGVSQQQLVKHMQAKDVGLTPIPRFESKVPERAEVKIASYE